MPWYWINVILTIISICSIPWLYKKAMELYRDYKEFGKIDDLWVNRYPQHAKKMSIWAQWRMLREIHDQRKK